MAQDDRFDLARLERLERRLQALEDAAAIRNLKARYAALCDAQYDADGIAAYDFSLASQSCVRFERARYGVSRGGCCLMTFPPLGANTSRLLCKGVIGARCGRRNRLCQTNLSWIELLQPSAARWTPGQCRRCR